VRNQITVKCAGYTGKPNDLAMVYAAGELTALQEADLLVTCPKCEGIKFKQLALVVQYGIIVDNCRFYIQCKNKNCKTNICVMYTVLKS
jgi:hypothetical protein